MVHLHTTPDPYLDYFELKKTWFEMVLVVCGNSMDRKKVFPEAFGSPGKDSHSMFLVRKDCLGAEVMLLNRFEMLRKISGRHM